MPHPEFVDFALELARSARAETLPRWSSGCDVEDKGSGPFDPVTVADREAERLMRSMIHERFPSHGVTGEEWPDQPAAGPLSWSLDPIDGTRSFICRLPTWTTLIALLEERAPVLGLIDAPALDETYVGGGDGAWMICKNERQPIRSSGCTRLSEARFSVTDPFLCGPPAEVLEIIRTRVRVTRYGHDAYAYARLAAGSIDLVIESGLKPHDYNALIPLITAAGGHVGNWRSGEKSSEGQILAAATRELYEEAAELLARAT